MKKLFAFLLALCLLLGLTACDQPDDPGEEKKEVADTVVYLPATMKSHFTTKNHYNEDVEVSFQRTYTYDEKGRCVGCTETGVSEAGIPYEYTLTLVYDAHGNVISETMNRKHTRDGNVNEYALQYLYEYTYDNAGRITRCAVTETNTKEADDPIVYDLSYDKNGNLIQASHSSAAEYYQYDDQGRLSAEIFASGFASEEEANTHYYYYKAAYTYDQTGNVTAITYFMADAWELLSHDRLETLTFVPYGTNLDYTLYYDEQGRLTGVNEPDQYAYDENGLLVREEVIETIKYRGEYIDRLISRYTCDEHGNVLMFESFNTKEEYTYVEMTLTKTDAKMAQRQFKVPTYLQYYFEPTNGVSNLQPKTHWLLPTYYYFPPYYRQIQNPIW